MYAPINREPRGLVVPVFMCPSFPYYGRSSEGDPAPPSCYAGCHHDSEAPIDVDNNGLLFLNSRIRYQDILDGSSNTILLGELVPSQSDLGWVSGTRATLRNTGSMILSMTGQQPTQQQLEVPAGGLGVGVFGSYHAGGGNFGLADGAVRFVADSIDPKLFQQLGHRADGELMKLDW